MFEFVLRTLCLTGWGFHVKPGFFNTFSGNLYLYDLNLELFQIIFQFQLLKCVCWCVEGEMEFCLEGASE